MGGQVKHPTEESLPASFLKKISGLVIATVCSKKRKARLKQKGEWEGKEILQQGMAFVLALLDWNGQFKTKLVFYAILAKWFLPLPLFKI